MSLTLDLEAATARDRHRLNATPRPAQGRDPARFPVSANAGVCRPDCSTPARVTPLEFAELGQSAPRNPASPSLNLYPAAEVQAAFLSGLPLERTGVDSERAPITELVRNEATNVLNTYTVGDALRITGADLKLDVADPAQGVFFRNATGTEVRATRYLTNTGGTLVVLVPAGLTGPQTLIVRVLFGPNLRQTTADAAVMAAQEFPINLKI
jgi:hypothetical protein